MTVLKGEGEYSILYSSTHLPLGRHLAAYVARPDAVGPHPTVIVAHPGGGITSHVKGVCRRLARAGMAAICPDLFRGADADEARPLFDGAGDGRLRADLLDAFETAEARGTAWSDGDRCALLGIGDGSRAAVLAAAAMPDPCAVALAAPSLADPPQGTGVIGGLRRVEAPVLGVVGAEDGAAETDRVEAARRSCPGSEWAVYGGMGPGFLDESAAGYDRVAAEDAWRRIGTFLARAVSAGS